MVSVMPHIVLDKTLRDLYASEGDSEDITLAYAVPTAEVQMSAGIPLSQKFSYQSPACPTHDSDILAREFLQLVPQLFGFVAGKMPLVMFDLDPDPAEPASASASRRPHQVDAHRVFGRLASDQRPDLTFASSATDLSLRPTTRLAIVNPMDCLLPHAHLVCPEAHYTALSKRALALSPIPTPPTTVLDTVLGPEQTGDAELLAFETERLLGPMTTRPLPFVAKLPQALSGQGVFLVRTEADRTAALSALRPETTRMLRGLTPTNAHLDPCCVLLQDLTPGEAVALSLFITRSGKAIFNACCRQLVDAEGNWGGGFVDYREQDALADKYRDTADRLGAYMHELGYWGPMGADVMIDAAGRQVVIDMNVRVTGSYPLGTLRGHFTSRGLNVATLFFPLMLSLTWDQFEVEFEEELRSGRLVVNAWVHMRDGKMSMTTVTLAAEDETELQAFVKRVKVFQADDH